MFNVSKEWPVIESSLQRVRCIHVTGAYQPPRENKVYPARHRDFSRLIWLVQLQLFKIPF